MDELLRHFFLFPLILLMMVSEFVYHPQRLFTGSATTIANPPGTWQKAAPLPSERYDFGSTVFENRLYVIGGLVLPTPWLPTNRVEAYDPKTDSWTRLKDYPTVVHHNGVVGCNEKLYVVGGYWLRIFPTARVYMYDQEHNDWVRKADLPVARGALGVACVSGKLYAMGGESGRKQFAQLSVYNQESNTWEEKAPMPTPREHLSVVVARGRIYALGGFHTSRYNTVAVNEVYDPQTNTWEKKSPLPHTISGFVAAVQEDSIFVFGGARGDSVSSEVFEYKILEDRWYRRADMPTKRYGLGGGTLNDGLHVIGGNEVVKGNFFSQDHDIFVP